MFQPPNRQMNNKTLHGKDSYTSQGGSLCYDTAHTMCGLYSTCQKGRVQYALPYQFHVECLHGRSLLVVPCGALVLVRKACSRACVCRKQVSWKRLQLTAPLFRSFWGQLLLLCGQSFVAAHFHLTSDSIMNLYQTHHTLLLYKPN